METNNLLTANSPIHKFSDEQIKKAISVIEGDSPLFCALGLIDAMGNYIANYEAIDGSIKHEYFIMSNQLQFHLELVKITVGYKD